MRRPDFEEKTYEKYFGWELIKHTRGAYSPGQCCEHHLGFDDAFFVRPWLLWRYPFLFPQWWTLLYRGISFSDIDRLATQISQSLPEFRFNLFVQYKRPEHVFGRRGAEWSRWRGPYFRYGITSHQQVALEGVYRESRGRAAVVYTAPVFTRSTTLYRHYGSGNIINNSNIVSVNELTGHSRYTYVSSGGDGAVHSDPEEVRGASFDEIMELANDQESIGFYDHVVRTARAIEVNVETDDARRTLLDLVRREVYSVASVAESQVGITDFVYALCTIFAFGDAFNASVYMIADVDGHESRQ